MLAVQRLDDHQLRSQQADAVDVQVPHPLELRRLGEVDEELGRRHRRVRSTYGGGRRSLCGRRF
jgi:hypothetical protein